MVFLIRVPNAHILPRCQIEKDLEEIWDNLAEAHNAPNGGNLLQSDQHIDNTDGIISIILMNNITLMIKP